MSRHLLFARHALDEIPKMLTLLDRNAHSPTFGCFDRNFWHYKIIDFPSGMAQEFVWPLALAFDTDVPDNPYYRNPAIRAWVEAGIHYAARSAHPDGSCDDYFPFERAAGAAAFSLLACMESYTLLGLNDRAMLDFFRLRASWLAHHDESGRLSNHQALIVLCLEIAGRLLNTRDWADAREQRLARILQWQHAEGWFPEYEGCDPGYQTLTIYCLARLHELTNDERLRQPLAHAARLAAQFVHPDGSFGGEYTSRNTYNFFPAGFEIVGRWLPDVLAANDLFLAGLERGLAPCYADDHIVAHHAWNYLLAYRHHVAERPALPPRPRGRIHLKDAGLLIDRRGDAELYLALSKGGVFKLFRGGQLIASDTGVSLRVRQGRKLKTAVTHLVGACEAQVHNESIIIRGTMGWAKHKQMTTMNLLVLRLAMLTWGRFFPNAVRKLLQKMLIVGKKPAPFEFERKLAWKGDRITVVDAVTPLHGWRQVVAAGIGASQTSIYVVMSRVFQAGQLVDPIDLIDGVRHLTDTQPLIVQRDL